jgi:hypothetical protein
MRKRGQSLIELGMGLMIFIPIVLLLIDLAFLVIATQTNSNTCREAARIAASGDPASARQRVMSVLERANKTNGGMLDNFRMTALDISPSDIASQIIALKPYGGTISGTVTVSCDVDVHPFIVQWAYSGGKPITFRATQSFPFTYVVPNTATLSQ